MAAMDPFASIAELCSVSSSQDEYLRRSRFALEPPFDSPIPFASNSSQDAASGDLPVESTAIRMESLPETPVEENRSGSSLSQPEPRELVDSGGVQASGGAGNGDSDDDSGDTLVIGGDSTEEDSPAVDLSKDSYPLFCIEPESDSTERIESEDKVILCDSEELRALDGQLGFGDGGVCESLIKSSKNPDKVVGSGNPVSEKNRKRLTRCLGLLQSLSEKQDGSSSCSRNPLLQTPQSNLCNDPALVVQRSILSLKKLGSPLTTAGEKQVGNCSQSMLLRTPVANLGMDPAVVLQRSLKSLEKLGSASKVLLQGSKSVEVHNGLASAIAMESSVDGRSEVADRGSGAKRKLEFLREGGLESDAAEETNVLVHEYNLDDVEHITTSQRDHSLCRSSKRAKQPSRSSPDVAALLGILNIFAAKEDDHDPTVQSMSLVDICKTRGMTFP